MSLSFKDVFEIDPISKKEAQEEAIALASILLNEFNKNGKVDGLERRTVSLLLNALDVDLENRDSCND